MMKPGELMLHLHAEMDKLGVNDHTRSTALIGLVGYYVGKQGRLNGELLKGASLVQEGILQCIMKEDFSLENLAKGID